MKIYIDNEYKCYPSNQDDILREFDVLFFDGKCDEFIRGYRYCPANEKYARKDGKIFYGECITPWKPYNELDAAQREYELAQLTQYKNKEQELNEAYAAGVSSI